MIGFPITYPQLNSEVVQSKTLFKTIRCLKCPERQQQNIFDFCFSPTGFSRSNKTSPMVALTCLTMHDHRPSNPQHICDADFSRELFRWCVIVVVSKQTKQMSILILILTAVEWKFRSHFFYIHTLTSISKSCNFRASAATTSEGDLAVCEVIYWFVRPPLIFEWMHHLTALHCTPIQVDT